MSRWGWPSADDTLSRSLPASVLAFATLVLSSQLDLGNKIPAKASRGQQPLAALVKSEIARWTPTIKAANIKRE